MKRIFASVLPFLFAASAVAQVPAPTEGGIFVGSTPCGAQVLRFLGIAAQTKCEFVRWELSLAVDVKNEAPGPAAATVEYGVYGKPLTKLKRDLTWAAVNGTAERKDAQVVELKRGGASLKLWRVNDETLHFLDSKSQLLVGDGGHSYALSVALAKGPEAPTAAPPDLAYKLLPLATGANVYGVFEGRTPCEIAKVVNIATPASCLKLKWRLTLFQDSKTKAPASYRLEGSLFPAGARAGALTPLSGTPFDAAAQVVRLELPDAERAAYVRGKSVEPIHLMRGDENVLFFLDNGGKLGLGNRDFNYALNRRLKP
ncbi:MAG: hypothetical protein H7Y89_06855 [Steroidobacteraceae bacterium]|nr:hypothetical protein [Steroidobacteraceae bacterium]